MNSDESDWDSMSEAPPVPATQQGVELRYPPAAAQSQPVGNPPVVFPPQKDQGKGPGPPQPQPRPKPQQSAPNPEPRPPSGKPPPEARAHPQSKKNRPKEVEDATSQKKIVVPDKISVSLDNSFSDLNQEQYEDSGLGSSPEKASNALKGVENQSYEGDNDDEDEEGRRGVAAGGGQEYRLPVPDERIALLPFEEMRTHYLQVEYDDEGLLVDRVLPTLVHCCSRASAELLGLVKLPLVLLLVCLGQVLKMVTSSLLRPASDHLLKPLLVSLHNLLLSPICSLLYNLSRMFAAIINPCCPTVVGPPWRYVHTSDSKSEQLQI